MTSHDCDETWPPLGNFLRTPLNAQMVKTVLTTTRAARIDTNHSTSFTLLLVIRTQRYMWTKVDRVRIAKYPQQSFCRVWQNIAYTSVSQRGRNRPQGSDFDGQGGEKNKGGETRRRGRKCSTTN